MKIKTLVALILILTFSTQSFAQEPVSEEDLNQAMCVIIHLRNSLQAQANASNYATATNANDVHVALEILARYQKDHDYRPGYVISGAGSVVTAAAVYTFWKSRNFFPLQESYIEKYLPGTVTALKNNSVETILSSFLVEVVAQKSKVFDQILRSSEFSEIDRSFGTISIFLADVPEIGAKVREFEELLPGANGVYAFYTSELNFSEKDFQTLADNPAFKRASELANEIDAWINHPRNFNTIRNVLKSQLPNLYSDIAAESDLLQSLETSRIEQNELNMASRKKYLLRSKVIGAFGVAAMVGGVVYEAFSDFGMVQSAGPEFWNMDEHDLRVYFSSHPKDVNSIILHSTEVGCSG